MDPGMRQQRHLTPGVSYFICHQDLKTDSIFACMHDNELEFELKSIRNNSRKKMDRTDELLNHLKKIVKVNVNPFYLIYIKFSAT